MKKFGDKIKSLNESALVFNMHQMKHLDKKYVAQLEYVS